MKTILRIIIILLVAAVVAGAFSLAVRNSSSASGTGQTATFSGANGQQPLGHFDGEDRDGGSGVEGLAGVLGTLLKLTGITLLVLAIQKGVSLLGNTKWKLVQR